MLKNKSNSADQQLLRRNFIWNLIGSTFSSFISLFFMMIVTRVNGIDDAGIFTFAFSAACVFYIIGVYSGRTFQITDKDKTFTDADYFYAKITTCGVMLLITLIFTFIRQYDTPKFLILLFLTLYKLLEAFSESTYAVIQKQNQLHQVGKSLLLKSLLSLIAFFIIDILTHNLILACTTIVIANFTVIIIYDLPCLHQAHFKAQKCIPSHISALLKRGFFAFGFTFLNLYVIQAAKFAIDITAGNDIQTYYGIIAMPATVLALFGNYVIQPFLTSLKSAFAKDIQRFTQLTKKLLLAVLLFGILCVLIAWPLGIPVLQLLYGIELPDCLLPLLLILIGGTMNTLVLVLSTALTTMRRTSGQFIVYLLTAILALFLSPFLVNRLGLIGAALSYLISMAVLLICYLALFTFLIHKLNREPNHDK